MNKASDPEFALSVIIKFFVEAALFMEPCVGQCCSAAWLPMITQMHQSLHGTRLMAI